MAQEYVIILRLRMDPRRFMIRRVKADTGMEAQHIAQLQHPLYDVTSVKQVKDKASPL